MVSPHGCDNVLSCGFLTILCLQRVLGSNVYEGHEPNHRLLRELVLTFLCRAGTYVGHVTFLLIRMKTGLNKTRWIGLFTVRLSPLLAVFGI